MFVVCIFGGFVLAVRVWDFSLKTSFEDSVVFVVCIYIGLVSLGVLWLLVVLYHFTVFVMDFSSFSTSVVPVLLSCGLPFEVVRRADGVPGFFCLVDGLALVGALDHLS